MHAEGPQILGDTVKNLYAQTTRRPGLGHPCLVVCVCETTGCDVCTVHPSDDRWYRWHGGSVVERKNRNAQTEVCSSASESTKNTTLTAVNSEPVSLL